METGDPKQVAVLSVMAVGAVGFLFTRMGGKHAEPPKMAAAQRAAAGPASVALTLLHDPFSHPHLATKPTKPSAEAPEEEPKGAPSPLMGSLPAASILDPGSIGKDAPVTAVLPPAGPLIAKKNHAPPRAAVPSPKTIGLEAIAGASATVAFLSVDGAESRPFGPREAVTPSVRVLRVEDGQVVLTGPHGKLTLGVGEKKSL